MSFGLIKKTKNNIKEERTQKKILLSGINKAILLNSSEDFVVFKIENAVFNIVNHTDCLLNFEHVVKNKFPITGNEWKKDIKTKSLRQLQTIKISRSLI